MLNNAVTIIFWVLFSICCLIAILMYLVIRGANLCKTEQDKIDELEEESRVLSEKYNDGGKSNG